MAWRGPKWKSLPIPLFHALCLFILIQSSHSAPVSSYLVSSFSSPNPRLPFRLMAVDNTTGDVYIGAEEEIYHLGSDFMLRETVEVGLCNLPGQEKDQNRLLVIAPAPTERLITCGACDGYCETRKLTNIIDAEKHNGGENNLVVKRDDVSMVGVVAASSDRSQYLFTGRLCVDTTDPNLESYTQIQLECTDQTGTNYNVIQAAHIGPAGSQLADSLSISSSDDIMYAVFTKENSSPVQSALCLYKMSDIQQRFTQVVVGCIKCTSDCGGRSIDYLHGSECGAVHVLNSSSAYQYENVPLGQGSVLRDVFLDEDKEQIILATGSDEGSQVLKLSLANCSNYQTCDECTGGSGGDDGDPYCGWCTLEARYIMPGQTDRRGQEYCPQLLGVPKETLIPVNIAAGYSIMASNLPTDPTKVTLYECVMHVDGTEQTVEVTDFNETFVNCPHRQFYPAIGPVAGGTRVEVFGTDLGVNFEGISSITVAGIQCDLNGMEEFYEPAQSVSCLTGRAGQIREGQIDLTLTLDGQMREASSEEEFAYRDPMISGFTPTEGPLAGGTRVTISGDFLTSGRNVIARFGDAECIDIARRSNETSCTTTESSVGSYTLTMTFDGTQLTTVDMFTFIPNPVITRLDRTQSIMSGGLNITVYGERFDLIQMPVIKTVSLTSEAETSAICNGNGSAIIITCPSPPYPGDMASRRRRQTEDGLTASLQFDFDGFVINPPSDIITYFPDPIYYKFDGPDSIFSLPKNNLLELNGGNLDLASNENDVQVFVGGGGKCVVQILESEQLICKMPDSVPTPGSRNGSLGEGPTRNLPAVHVRQGNVDFDVGYVEYPTGLPLGAIIGGACGGAVLIIIVMVLVAVGVYRRSYKNLDRQAQELELVEKKIQRKVEAAFHELQSDMTEVETQVVGLGIPFVNAQDYARNMLFAGLNIIPSTADPQEMDDKLEHAMIIFSRQLSNPDFLVRYIQVLEEKKKSFRRERVNIASLITIILVSEGKFEYFTGVLKTLLEEQISDSSDTGRLRSLFRRTETIIEKLLSNWMAISMFSFLKSHVAKSLYLLYQAIKIQCEKGPIDVINGQSYFSLNIDCLLDQDVECSELTLSVVGSNGRHDYYVKVLNVDSIIQVKQKILDAAYRRRHLVRQRRAHEMDLLWYHPGGEQRILRDQDEFNTRVHDDEPVVINTIQAVGIEDGARVALIEKVKKSDDESRAFQPVSMSEEPPSAGVKESRIQLDKEISAPRLLVTKRTVEPFLNDFLSAVFKKVDETPATLKHLFDFFDEMAATYCSGSGQENPDDCAEAWKSNSLPQHYWVTTLTHPSYVFDMRQSRCADQSVSVLANMLDNACKKVIPEMTEDSSLNRVLFVKDLPGYIKTISEYYGGIARRPAPTAVELQREYNEIRQEFTGLFSRFGSLKLLYDFTCRDAAELLDAVAEMMSDNSDKHDGDLGDLGDAEDGVQAAEVDGSGKGRAE
ncbi:plexin-A4-like [Diadema setosum]|uniref:plexin-A4-like n=1 Tax=Diadema setosum TaxID=31175 RepID=UPI003B3B1DD8